MMKSIPERATELLEFLHHEYPRTVSIIRLHWGDPQAQVVFENLLTYNHAESKDGFSFQAFSAITELQEIHARLAQG